MSNMPEAFIIQRLQEARFKVHWILPKGRIYLPSDVLSGLPRVGDELRANSKTFYRVKRLVWCLDEENVEGQRVNIEIEKIK